MTYTSHVPAPPLNAYIDDLYYLDSPAPYPRMKVLPLPSLHLMVNLGGTSQVYAPDNDTPLATCSDSWFIGLWNSYHTVAGAAHTSIYGVHFKPGGTYPFLQLPLSELRNQVVPLDAIWGRFAAELRERLYAAPTIQAGLALLERLLLARLREAQGLDVVQYAVERLSRQHGALPIHALCDDIGISHNHLATQFKRMVGVTPKQLARFYRFEHVLASIDPLRPVEWTRIAHQADFYDQAHFNKDFLAFTGHNPGDYLRIRRTLAQDPAGATLGQLPTD
jgi:AraC-like DNA-binding protein